MQTADTGRTPLDIPGSPPRVLIFAPLGRDGPALAEIAGGAGLSTLVLKDVDDLEKNLDERCAVLMVTQEALDSKAGQVLRTFVDAQPVWSALPVLALIANPSKSPPALDALESSEARIELLVLRRPAHPDTLRSALRTMSASRQSQYRIGHQLRELERNEAHLKFLLAELDHRVKNILAKIMSILRLTRREASDVESFAAGFEGRTQALAAAHDMLGGSDTSPSSVGKLVENALAPYANRTVSNVHLEGPDVNLWPQGALSLAMALYELATNAVKHGALADGGGMVRVQWDVIDGEFQLEWQESGGSEVAVPAKTSFGTKLLTVLIPHELGGSTTLEFKPEGVQWRVRAPYPTAEE